MDDALKHPAYQGLLDRHDGPIPSVHGKRKNSRQAFKTGYDPKYIEQRYYFG